MIKEIELELDEIDLLSDMKLETIVEYLSDQGLGVYDAPSLANLVNNSALDEDNIIEFLSNLDEDTLNLIKSNINNQ